MKLSLIIPCYNECRSLPQLISRLDLIFKDKPVEIIIVDNGSTDNTPEIIRGLAKASKGAWRSIRVAKNIGYGHGIISGLNSASGDVLAWTHADLQTDPADVLLGFEYFLLAPEPQLIFAKGLRYGRPMIDAGFTLGMTIFESVLMRAPMRDINAQPTMFHRDFLKHLKNPPDDFALDLFVYWTAVKNKLQIKRFPVHFGPRVYGASHWNTGMKARYRFIKRTISYSIKLYNNSENK